MRLPWITFVCACSGTVPAAQPSAVQATSVSAPAPAVEAEAARTITVAASVTPTPPPPIQLSTGSHGLGIVALALAEDGNAAFTIDSGSHGRLWPTLDGTREPFVVPLASGANSAALQRVGDAFAIAILDSAGHLAVRRVDNQGNLSLRVAVASEVPFASVVAAGAGFLAIRSDQAIQLIDLDGNLRTALVPDPGEHVATVLHRHGRALAMVDTQEAVYGRWLAITSNELAWGERTPDLDIEPRLAMLDPSARVLASVKRKTTRGVLVDLATGTSTALRGGGSGMIPLGFLGEDRVAFSHTAELLLVEWFDTTGKRLAKLGEDFELDGVFVQNAETGGDRVVAFDEGSLVIIAPKSIRFLGYGQQTITQIVPTTLGLVATIGAKPTTLDDQLRRARDLPKLDHGFAIDDARGVVAKSRRVELVALEDRSTLQTLPFPMRSSAKLVYEPTTRTLAINGGKVATFVVLDRSTARFGAPAIVDTDITIDTIAMLDPTLANGRTALLVRMKPKVIDIRTVRADALEPDALISASEPLSLAGELEAIDRAGHLYVRTAADTIGIFDGDRELGHIGNAARLQVRPSPDGTRALIFSTNRMALVDTKGAGAWEIAFPGVTDAEWTSNTELVVAAGGLVKLDVATGAIRGGQCGWSFGLRSSQRVERTGATVCDRR